MKNPLITAAVVAALAGASHGAMALDVATTITTIANGNSIVAAGASAARDSFLAELANNVCQSGASTLAMYRALPTALQDFRVYSCTITAGGTLGTAFGAAAGQNVAVYYRAEGGSAWGPTSIALNTSIKSLVVDNACVAAATTTAAGTTTIPVFDCAFPAGNSYRLSDDNEINGGAPVAAGPSRLTLRATQLGISDVEPNMFVDLNYPGVASSRFPPFSATVQTALNGLTRTIGFAQTFGVLVSDSGVTATITSLTPAEVAGIYSGTITDWGSTFNPTTGVRNASGQIKVVRRENGSGTQVGAAAFFLGTSNCSPTGALAFVFNHDAGDNGACTAINPTGGTDTDNVLERGATGDLEACVRFNPGAIGPNVFKATPPTGTHYVQLSGVAPSKYAAARNDYRYWFELALEPRSGLTGVTSGLAAGLTTISQRQANTPTTDSAFALANLNNTPVLPVATTGVPIGVARRGGNSCSPAAQVFIP
jgi:ABC-type phosphate transport system substrate-binding protein